LPAEEAGLNRTLSWAIAAVLAALPTVASAVEPVPGLVGSWVGIGTLLLFVAAYAAVILEEFTHLRKSLPVMLAAGLIWGIIAMEVARRGVTPGVEEALTEFLIEFSELFLFLLATMTYVNAMSERNIFMALRSRLTRQGFSYRHLFWITGAITFFLSPLIDNLTAALVMCAVVMAVGKDSPRFVSLSCVNIVIAANAGGAFSPFGDITTLMIWQEGLVQFQTFLALFFPSVVNYLVPASLIYLALPKGSPAADGEAVVMKRGSRRIMLLFGATIATTVSFHNFLHLPPYLGMITGLAYLKLFGYYLYKTHVPRPTDSADYGEAGDIQPFDSFKQVARVEWDTLLFFFGIIMCVGGLGTVGYLQYLSSYFYGDLGPTTANVLVGLISSVLDNIPVVVAVLQMRPEMDLSQWLLVTLTAGVGGSLLSIGSAAGVALMGQARGAYTFAAHLRWTPAIALGYALSIAVHLLVNAGFKGLAPG
jgi:Na+/H+ antiporter NhaD/arsenite permease-like protein